MTSTTSTKKNLQIRPVEYAENSSSCSLAEAPAQATSNMFQQRRQVVDGGSSK